MRVCKAGVFSAFGHDREIAAPIADGSVGITGRRVELYTQIVFRSTAAEPAGAGAWTVPGELSLHGQTPRITVQVRERDGHYVEQYS